MPLSFLSAPRKYGPQLSGSSPDGRSAAAPNRSPPAASSGEGTAAQVPETAGSEAPPQPGDAATGRGQAEVPPGAGGAAGAETEEVASA